MAAPKDIQNQAEVLTRGEHRVRIVPINWMRAGSKTIITKSACYCSCGWDTKQQTSMSMARGLAMEHIGLKPVVEHQEVVEL